jgi:hypothetical protein
MLGDKVNKILSQNLNFSFILFFLLALALFVVRGPLRSVNNSADLTGPYLQSFAWRHGCNPYQPAKILVEKFFPNANNGKGFNGGIYPPTTSLLMMPITYFHWDTAKKIWMMWTIFIFSVTMYFLGKQLIIKFNNYGGLKLSFIVLLAFSPFHTGIALGQVSIIVICFMILSFLFSLKNYITLSGFLLALAVGLKPQLALFLVVFYLLRKKYRILTFFGAMYALIIISSEIYPVIIDGNQLGSSWTMWLKRVFAGYGVTGGERFLYDDIDKFSTLNIQVLVSQFFHNSFAVKTISFTIYISMILFFIYFYFNNKKCDEFIIFSLLSILILLPVYHRFYDASLLIVPLLWSILKVKKIKNEKKLSFLALLLLLFSVPGGTILILLTPRLPQIISNSAIWNFIVLPHQVWILLISYILMIFIMKHDRIQQVKV